MKRCSVLCVCSSTSWKKADNTAWIEAGNLILLANCSVFAIRMQKHDSWKVAWKNNWISFFLVIATTSLVKQLHFFFWENNGCIQEIDSSHYSQWWKSESISSKNRNKTRVPTLDSIVQHSLGSLSYRNQRRQRHKRNPDWKLRSKAFTICRWHDTVSSENYLMIPSENY